MGNLSKPTILKKVIATFVLCSATFFALSCFTILGRFNWVESLSLWIFVPNIVVGLLFGFVITILLLISDRIKQRRRRLFIFS